MKVAQPIGRIRYAKERSPGKWSWTVTGRERRLKKALAMRPRYHGSFRAMLRRGRLFTGRHSE